MKREHTQELISEFMNELAAYQERVIVIKVGGNSIAEDTHFLTKIAQQIKFLQANGVQVILIHGGGPQIDQALRMKSIESSKGPDGRRITSPKAMRVVHQVMREMNHMVVDALIEEGCAKDKIFCAASSKRFLVEGEPIDTEDRGIHNRSGKPKSVATQEIKRLLAQGKILVLHSVASSSGSASLYNINGDDYATAIAVALGAKRLILVTNVPGVLDKNRNRIPLMDQKMAEQMIAEGVITSGMIPKVESALDVVKQGVGGVAIIDGFTPWAILAEILTHDGFGTLFQARVG